MDLERCCLGRNESGCTCNREMGLHGSAHDQYNWSYSFFGPFCIGWVRVLMGQVFLSAPFGLTRPIDSGPFVLGGGLMRLR